MLQDFRFALRGLLRSRAFTVAAVLTLAIGMGATTIVYAIVDALLLRPLPFGERSGRLVTVHSTHPTQQTDWDDAEVSYADLLDLRESSASLEALEGLLTRNVSISSRLETERVAAASITPGLFSMLGVVPQLGRDFRPDDGAAPGTETVALISDGIWQRHFGMDPAIVGRTLPLNGRVVTIVGVMPRGFGFPEQHAVWLPLRLPREEGRDRRGLTAIGLVRPGQQLQDVRHELAAAAAVLASSHPETNRDWGIHVLPLRELFVRESTRRGLTAMLVAVGLVLLVGCANVGSLLVTRGIGRSRELMVRAALGAGRWRLIWFLMAETMVLTAAATGLAILGVTWGIDALLASMPEPPPYWAQVRVDGRVLAFTGLVSMLAATLSGLVPSLRGAHAGAAVSGLHGARTSGTLSQRRLQGTLVAAQVAFSLALLVGATLLMKSTITLQAADIGLDGGPLLSARVYLAGEQYDDPGVRAQVLQRLTERLSVLPGVAAVAATGSIPGDDGGDAVRIVPPRGLDLPGGQIGAQLVPITGSLFDTLGLTLLEGRTFSPEEVRRPDSDVVVVNARLAARLWPGEGAVGRELRLIAADRTAGYRIIGVAPDVTYEELGEETDQSRLIVYVPYARAGWRTMALLVRSPGDPGALAATVPAAVRGVDPFFATYDVLTMDERRAVTSWGERFLGRTFAAFAVTALFLACVGVYGVAAHLAIERRREIGIRLAIGAKPADIVRLLVGRGGVLSGVGVLGGVPLAFGASKLVESLLFNVSSWDLQAWTVLPVALIVSVLLASLIPALRASRIEATEALRD